MDKLILCGGGDSLAVVEVNMLILQLEKVWSALIQLPLCVCLCSIY